MSPISTGHRRVDKMDIADTVDIDHTVDIVNTVSPTTTHTTSWSWEIDLSTGDGQNSVPKGFGIGETC